MELDKFREDTTRVAAYEEGLKKFKLAGIFDFLRGFARPYSYDKGDSQGRAAYSAAYCEGYNSCLDDLLYFGKLHLDPKVTRSMPRMDFGGLRLAVEKGYMTVEEAAKVRGGK